MNLDPAVINVIIYSVIILLLYAVCGYYMVKFYRETKMKKHLSPFIVVDQQLFSDMVTKLNQAEAELREGHEVRSVYGLKPVLEKANKLLVEYNDFDIDRMVQACQEPLKRIIVNVLDAIEDGKINMNDVGNGYQIVRGVAHLAQALPEMGVEIQDLSQSEIEVLFIVALRAVYESRAESKTN